MEWDEDLGLVLAGLVAPRLAGCLGVVDRADVRVHAEHGERVDALAIERAHCGQVPLVAAVCEVG